MIQDWDDVENLDNELAALVAGRRELAERFARCKGLMG
jgi:hypothetical protein